MGELVKNSSISVIGARRLVSKDTSWGLLLNLAHGVVDSVLLVKSPAQQLYLAPWLWIVLLPIGSNGDAAELRHRERAHSLHIGYRIDALDGFMAQANSDDHSR